MAVPTRRGVAALVLVLLLLGGTGTGLPESSPGGCPDGCDDEAGRTGCADCPLCSPARAAVLVSPGQSPAAELLEPYPAFAIERASRPEERGVFHVPRHLA